MWLKHICLRFSLGPAGSAALGAGVSLVSILQVGDWARVFTLARHYFPLTLLLWIGTRTLQYAMLGLCE